MSASFASITGLTDSPPLRADHGEFLFSAGVLSARTHREMGSSMIAKVDQGVHAELRREKDCLKLLWNWPEKLSRTRSFATLSEQ